MKAIILENVWLQRLRLNSFLGRLDVETDLMTRYIKDVWTYVRYHTLGDGKGAIFFIDYTWQSDSLKLAKYVIDNFPLAKVVLCCNQGDNYWYLPVEIVDQVLVTIRPYELERIRKAVYYGGAA